MQNGLVPHTYMADKNGVPQWTEHGPANQRIAASIPSQGHACIAGQVSSRGCARGNHTMMFLSLSPSLPLSLKINTKYLY